MRKILAVDFGLKRIGLASYTEGDVLAFPEEPLVYKEYANLVKNLQKKIVSEQYTTVLIGLPLGLDEKETEMSKKTRDFSEDLKKEIGGNIEIIFWNETLTSKLADTNLKKLKINKSIDSESARIILQEYLDYQNETPHKAKSG